MNFCKNTHCASFCVPPNPAGAHYSRTTGAPGEYTVSGAGRGLPVLVCTCCRDHSPIRSNAAVLEEIRHQGGYLEPTRRDDPFCKNPECEMFKVRISLAPDAYVRFGTTPIGTQRFRCRACGSTFTGNAPRATARQRKSHKNRDVFILTVNKVPISRILETADIGAETFYRKLQFIHERCQAFAGQKEARLAEGKIELPKLYLSTDRQAYIVNWAHRKDRRTIQMNAIGTADWRSGFVFGMALNFDGSLDPKQVEADARDTGDMTLQAPYRKYARLWLSCDYVEAVEDAKVRNAAEKATRKIIEGTVTDPLMVKAALRYADALSRQDVERSDFKNTDVTLPKFGMLVHEQYTMTAHFQLLSRLLWRAPKVRLFMDQDSGFRAAAIGAFGKRIKERTADLFYVQVNKEQTAYEKRQAVVAAQAIRLAYMKKRGLATEREAAVELMKERIAKAVKIAKWEDRWVPHAWPIAAEPAKLICWLTDLGDYDLDHQARLMLLATLHPIDRFFMQTRRRVSLAERPVTSVRKQRRMWHGYGAYNPAVLQRYLEIYRTYYNYCLIGQDKKTPAMRLGLAQVPQDPSTILNA